jgi:chromosome segregation ATPase
MKYRYNQILNKLVSDHNIQRDLYNKDNMKLTNKLDILTRTAADEINRLANDKDMYYNRYNEILEENKLNKQSIERQKDELRRQQVELSELQRVNLKLETDYEDLSFRYDEIKEEMEKAKTDVETIEEELIDANKEIETLEESINDYELKLDASYDTLEEWKRDYDELQINFLRANEKYNDIRQKFAEWNQLLEESIQITTSEVK